jgi:hypothetical protein
MKDVEEEEEDPADVSIVSVSYYCKMTGRCESVACMNQQLGTLD